MQENFVLNEKSVSQNPAIEVLKRMGYTYLYISFERGVRGFARQSFRRSVKADLEDPA